MKLSIIIPCHNEAAMLPETLASIARCRAALLARAIENELIVVANNCTDETGAIALAGDAIVIHDSTRTTAAAARNAGARFALDGTVPPDWLLFIDADASPSFELLCKMLTVMGSAAFDAGSCLVQPEGDATFGHDLWNTLAPRLKRLCGAFLFISGSKFKEIGGFNPETATGEELEFARKLTPARITILTDSRVLLRSRKRPFRVA